MWWKIVESHEYGESYRTLKHGNGPNGRLLVRDTWLEATAREVRDGSGRTWYKSGWHVLATLGDAEDYHAKFKKRTNLIIIPVWAHEVRRKQHSRDDVFLARWIRIGEFPE